MEEEENRKGERFEKRLEEGKIGELARRCWEEIRERENEKKTDSEWKKEKDIFLGKEE